jgi:hypothetical protein
VDLPVVQIGRGRLYAAPAATLYWITIPLLMGGSAAVGIIAAIKIFWFGDASILLAATW